MTLRNRRPLTTPGHAQSVTDHAAAALRQGSVQGTAMAKNGKRTDCNVRYSTLNAPSLSLSLSSPLSFLYIYYIIYIL